MSVSSLSTNSHQYLNMGDTYLNRRPPKLNWIEETLSLNLMSVFASTKNMRLFCEEQPTSELVILKALNQNSPSRYFVCIKV